MSFLPGKLRAEHAQDRWPNDWYIETPASVHALFDTVEFYGAIHDPACGAGNIPTIARLRGFMATGSDLVYRGFGSGDVNFLSDNTRRINIVTNPPYKIAEGFAAHAISVAERKVAVVVRISFLAGQKRRVSLFERHPSSVVVVLSTRPSMPPGGTDIPAKGGTADYCWIVWDSNHDGPTEIRWAA